MCTASNSNGRNDEGEGWGDEREEGTGGKLPTNDTKTPARNKSFLAVSCGLSSHRREHVGTLKHICSSHKRRLPLRRTDGCGAKEKGKKAAGENDADVWQTTTGHPKQPRQQAEDVGDAW